MRQPVIAAVNVVGIGQAAEMMFTGRRVDAAAAARISLVNRVVAQDQLLTEATAMAQAIAGFSAFGTAPGPRGMTRREAQVAGTEAAQQPS